MKDERSKKLYDGITSIDDELVEQAQADTPRRSRPWLKWAALAACLVIVVVGAIKLWPSRDPAQQPQPGTEQQKPGQEQEPEPGEPMDPEPGTIMGPDGEDIQMGEVVPMIDSFGESTYAEDMTVANGGCVFSDSLEAAMRAYGDSVRYRVMIEFFRDGVQLDSGGEIAMREFDKLADAGYIPALEAYNDGSVTHHYFTIHATLKQLLSYPLDEELGYSFLLYGEYFVETYADTPIAFSGAVNQP